MAHQEMSPRQISFGPSVLKLQVATEMLMDLPHPQEKRRVPTPAKTVSPLQSAPAAAELPVSPSSPNTKTEENMRTQFKAELRAKIEENKYYPPLSRRLGQTGTVIVGFTLLEDGHIIDVRIDTPSRYDRLNDSAMDAVKKVHKFRPIPKEFGESKMDIKVPVRFFTI